MATIPHMTDRGTIINNGNEYTISSQLRLKPGEGTPQKTAGQLDSLVSQRSTLINKDLWNNLAAILGAGAGAGLAARGAQGLYNMGRRSLTTPKTIGPKTITVPTLEEEEEEKRGFAKSAGNFFSGGNASDWTGHPLAIPGSVAAATAGGLGGWKLMDYILDKQRKAEQKSELEKAKQQYESALQSAYHKKASELGKDLDRLYDLVCEKQATLGDTAGKTFGMLAMPAGALAIASGIITHNIASKRRQQALLRKATAKRRRQQSQLNPTRIYAMPQPLLPSGSMNAAPNEEELNGSPLD